MKTFLDTNVFIYAIGGDHPLREPCVGVLDQVGRGDLEASTNTEVLQEILFVLSRRGHRDTAIGYVQDVLDLIPDPLPIGKAEIALAALLMRSHSNLLSRDAIHLASMRTNGMDTIITADRDFDGIDDVTRLDPADVKPLES